MTKKTQTKAMINHFLPLICFLHFAFQDTTLDFSLLSLLTSQSPLSIPFLPPPHPKLNFLVFKCTVHCAWFLSLFPIYSFF